MKLRITILLCALSLVALGSGTYGCNQVEDITKDITDAAEGALKDIEQGINEAAKTPDNQPGEELHGSQTDMRGQSITDYFGGETVYFYRQINGSTVFCESGDCPDSIGSNEYLVNEECFFCAESSEVFDDKLIAHISPLFLVDTFAGCTTKSNFTYPNELKIIEKTAAKIVAEGTGNGNVEQVGDSCSETYTHRYETDETWIFTMEKLEAQSTVTVTTDAPGNIILAPGWSNPQSAPLPYSQHSLTVACTSPHGFRVTPNIKVTKVNGQEASTSIHFNREVIDDATARYTFAASFNADYTVVGVCRTYGKNGALLAEKVSDAEIIVRVTDSPQGDLPEDQYTN